MVFNAIGGWMEWDGMGWMAFISHGCSKSTFGTNNGSNRAKNVPKRSKIDFFGGLGGYQTSPFIFGLELFMPPF